MSNPEADPSSRRLLSAALLSSVLTAVAFVAFAWGRLLLTGDAPSGFGETLIGVSTGVALSTVAFVPFLLAVLLVVASPSRRSVAGGAALVYAIDLSLTVGQALLNAIPVGPVVLAVPLARVATFLAVATAVWLAFHGGYDRLVSAAGNADQHPLFAVVADRRIGPALSLQRGLVAAGLAALVGAGGLVLAGGIADLLRTVVRSGTGSSVVVFPHARVWNVGIPLAHFPKEWPFEASFLLGVLFVTGPRLGLRDLLKGIAVVLGVQSTAELLPALLPPFRPVDLWTASGPLFSPVSDVLLLSGIAVAVWLAFHTGPAPLRRRPRSE
ncbi:hypothetical protein [Salinigranum sp. GCM10025319]|uniref:hypothetical protein n=1 Tax=Salinigranum sp. GCM10025319 TaxID=3252687 RepID=UPI0036080E71